MVRKISLSVILLLGLAHFLKAQEPKTYNDRIFLNNGSVLSCKIISYNPIDSIIFEFTSGQKMTYPSSFIKKIKMEDGFKHEKLYSFKENKWYTRSQFSVLYSKDQKGISISQSVGYQYRHWLGVGLGMGLDNYKVEKGNNLMPVFAEIRSYFIKENTSPYLAVRYGYGFAFEQTNLGQINATGSCFFNPVIGYRLGAGIPYFDLFCGIKFQEARYQTRDNWSKATFDISYRRYDLGLALTF